MTGECRYWQCRQSLMVKDNDDSTLLRWRFLQFKLCLVTSEALTHLSKEHCGVAGCWPGVDHYYIKVRSGVCDSPISCIHRLQSLISIRQGSHSRSSGRQLWAQAVYHVVLIWGLDRLIVNLHLDAHNDVSTRYIRYHLYHNPCKPKQLGRMD